MKRHICISIFLFLAAIPMFAQNNSFQERYDAFKQQATKKYNDFRDECNRKYAEFMLESWKTMYPEAPVPKPKRDLAPPVIYDDKAIENNQEDKENKGKEIQIDTIINVIVKDSPENDIRREQKKKFEPVFINDDPLIIDNVDVILADLEIDQEDIEIKLDNDLEEIVHNLIIDVTQPAPIGPIEEITQPIENAFCFEYEGTPVKVRMGLAEKISLSSLTRESVSRAWTILSNKDLNNAILDCLNIRDERALCDWAYLNMLYKLACDYYDGECDEATVMTAYFYCQSGYTMRLGVDRDGIVLLFATKHIIYDSQYYDINGQKFFVFNRRTDGLKICDFQFPNTRPLSLYINGDLWLADDYSSPRFLKSERYPEVNAYVSVNKNLISFYNSYPSSEIGGDFMTRWAMYANKPLELGTATNLYDALIESIAGLSELEAVERVLNFVQTAFVYEYDDVVWGEDRAFFAEESLYYPYCDCEDRSILFSRIVRDILGLNVILIYYPGHLATAVEFSNPVLGDYIMVNEHRFTVCDPTYINANVGMTMPGMDNAKANVILTN